MIYSRLSAGIFPSMRLAWLMVLAFSLCACAREKLELVRPAEYSGMCDASAGVALSSNLFAVANDEDNVLRVYRADKPGPPVRQFDFNRFLEVRGKSAETDLEGAARIGYRAYWIGSHGRNRAGKERLNRDRFFATDIQVAGEDVLLVPAGKPYENLLLDLLADSRLQRFHLAEAAQKAPKEPDAFNIEGLSATPEGRLLIGFRNPLPEGKALLVPMLNPELVIEGERAKLGAPILLELGGLGVRDIALWEKTYIIIAGPYDGGGKFHLYKWDGQSSAPVRLKVDHLNQYNPEGIVIYPQKGLAEFQLLSDDGTRLIGGVPGKELPVASQRTFRSFWVRTAPAD
jgi:hypothetical protein